MAAIHCKIALRITMRNRTIWVNTYSAFMRDTAHNPTPVGLRERANEDNAALRCECATLAIPTFSSSIRSCTYRTSPIFPQHAEAGWKYLTGGFQSELFTVHSVCKGPFRSLERRISLAVIGMCSWNFHDSGRRMQLVSSFHNQRARFCLLLFSWTVMGMVFTSEALRTFALFKFYCETGQCDPLLGAAPPVPPLAIANLFFTLPDFNTCQGNLNQEVHWLKIHIGVC